MQSTEIQSSPGWQLEAGITRTPYGIHLVLSSSIASARTPHRQVKFSGLFSEPELRKLRDAIDQALGSNT
jgi:hypothetical protein